MIRRLGLLLLVSGCTTASLQVSDSFDLGTSPVGVANSKTLTLTNTGTGALDLTLHIDGTEFVAASSSTHLEAGQTAGLSITFTPAALGTRDATLIIAGADRPHTVSLHGNGKGGQLLLPEMVTLTTALITPGIFPAESTGTLTLRNVGNRDVPLVVESIAAEPPTLCINTACSGANDLRLGSDVISLPLSASIPFPGTAEWTLTITTDEPLLSTRTVVVRASAEQLDLCRFDAPQTVVLTAQSKELFLHHAGAQRCQVREVSFSAEPGIAVDLDTVALPALVDATTPFRIGLHTSNVGTRPLGVLRITPTGAEPIAIDVRSEQLLAATISPSSLNFGTVGRSCSRLARAISIYNPTPIPLTIESVISTSQEFIIVQGLPEPVTIEPGGTPLSVQLKYVPFDLGIDEAALLIETREQGTLVVSLSGNGDVHDPAVDTYAIDPKNRFDFVFVVDTSPSFAPYRPVIRQRIEGILRSMNSRCVDARAAFMPADVGAGSSVDFSRSTVGEVWTPIADPDFVNRSLSAFDALPTGSEVEGCIGPLSQRLPASGARTGIPLVAMCISDALEQSVNPLASLTAVRSQFPSLRWTAAVGTPASTCPIESIDNGIHQQLTSAGEGERYDVCRPERWLGSTFGNDTCSIERLFYLNNTPENGEVSVTLNGALAAPGTWQYDATQRAVRFTPGVLQGGDMVTLRYVPACTQ